MCNMRKDSVLCGGRVHAEGYVNVYQQCSKNACEEWVLFSPVYPPETDN